MSTETQFRIRPSKKLLTLIGLYNSTNAAAETYGIPTGTLIAWLDQKGDLPSRHVAAILERTCLPYEELFEHEEERR